MGADCDPALLETEETVQVEKRAAGELSRAVPVGGASDPIRHGEHGGGEPESPKERGGELAIVCVTVVHCDHDGSGGCEPALPSTVHEFLESKHGATAPGEPAQLALEPPSRNDEAARRLARASEGVVHEDHRASRKSTPRVHLEPASGPVPVGVALEDGARAPGASLADEPA